MLSYGAFRRGFNIITDHKNIVTGRVACKQMVPKDERQSIGEGKKEREGRI